jgi:hypothetical protein
MQLTRLAATAAPAILVMMLSSTSWANCDNPGAYNCVSGVVHFEAASNGCYKVRVQPSEGNGVEFALQYSLPLTAADALNLSGKIAALADGSSRSILYTGLQTSCSGMGYAINGPVRNIDFPSPTP